MNVNRLSPREYEVNTLIAKGLEAKQIAAKLFLSVDTVRTHIKSIKRKTGARNIADLTRNFVLSLDNPKKFFAAIMAVMLQCGIIAYESSNDLRRRPTVRRISRIARTKQITGARYV